MPDPTAHGKNKSAVPAAEVQDGVRRDDADDDEEPGHSHGDVIGWIGHQHVLADAGAKGQEATDSWEKRQSHCFEVKEVLQRRNCMTHIMDVIGGVVIMSGRNHVPPAKICLPP